MVYGLWLRVEGGPEIARRTAWPGSSTAPGGARTAAPVRVEGSG